MPLIDLRTFVYSLLRWFSPRFGTAYLFVTSSDPDKKWQSIVENTLPTPLCRKFMEDIHRSDPEKEWERRVLSTFDNVFEAALAEQREAERLTSIGIKLYKKRHGTVIVNGHQYTVPDLISMLRASKLI